jgi:hypothetical protein
MKPVSESKFARILWRALLVSLPFTSLPILSRLFGGTSVAPLSLVFLALLAVIFFIPNFLKLRTLPRESLPLLVFVLLALISCGLAYFRPIPSFREIPIWRNQLEGLVTLAMGIGFYLITLAMITKKSDMLSSLKWLNIGGLIILASALVQMADWQIGGAGYSQSLLNLQTQLSASGLLYPRRAAGLAFEPSWLAHQLNALYLPLWLGMSLSGYSAYKFRLLKRITIENLLLIGGLLTLFYSFSRVGWLTMVLLAAYILFRAANRLFNHWLEGSASMQHAKSPRIRKFFYKLLLWIGLALLLVLVVLFLGWILTRLDPRMEDLFDLNRLRQFGILGWASQLMFAERLIYWISGFQVYLRYPLFGTGFGGMGYFFEQVVPEFGYKLPEIIKALVSESFIPNSKNLWVRLLAETGIVGMSAFTTWLVLHWQRAKQLERSGRDALAVAFGLVGQLFLLALLMEGFSLDTFGLPYYWIAIGLLASVGRLRENTPVEPAN